jgi:putative transposase
MMRYTPAEKFEIIRLVEQADVPAKRVLAELGIARSTFYDWYRRYGKAGYAGLADHSSQPHQFWNRIPDTVREEVVQIAIERTELSPHELAWRITDHQGYFISESSTYRILEACDLVTSPVFQLVSANANWRMPPKLTVTAISKRSGISSCRCVHLYWWLWWCLCS